MGGSEALALRLALRIGILAAQQNRETLGGGEEADVDGYAGEKSDAVRAMSAMMFLRYGLSPARLKTFGMLASAVFALGAAVLAARSANAMFDAWFWMLVVWGVVVLVGVLFGIVRNGLPDKGAPTPSASGDATSNLTAAVTRWSSERLPAWHRATGAVATISAAIAGAAIAAVTGEVFLGMPFSWWVIGMVILA